MGLIVLYFDVDFFCADCTPYVYFTEWPPNLEVKGVKKVRSALYHMIRKHFVVNTNDMIHFS